MTAVRKRQGTIPSEDAGRVCGPLLLAIEGDCCRCCSGAKVPCLTAQRTYTVTKAGLPPTPRGVSVGSEQTTPFPEIGAASIKIGPERHNGRHAILGLGLGVWAASRPVFDADDLDRVQGVGDEPKNSPGRSRLDITDGMSVSTLVWCSPWLAEA